MNFIEETAKRVAEAIEAKEMAPATVADLALIPRETFRRRIAGSSPGFYAAELHRVGKVLQMSGRDFFPEAEPQDAE